MWRGVWLGTAAVCSGAAWQPIVNFWQGLGVSFPVVFAGAWVGCGFMFFSGLRPTLRLHSPRSKGHLEQHLGTLEQHLGAFNPHLDLAQLSR